MNAAQEALTALGRLPRVRLANLPTALESAPGLAAALGLQTLRVKRDDCTGLAFGGNKTRQLEWYLGDALEHGADTILITGAVQSNFVRQAAAAAARLGLGAHVQLEQRVPKDDPRYQRSGNVLLDRLLGAQIHHYPFGEDEAGADAALEALADSLRNQGARPYVIHLAPGHRPLGALGYVDCARELLAQLGNDAIAGSGAERDAEPVDALIVPSGSGATHAGLLFGLRVLGCSLPVIGACVRREAALQRPRLLSRCAEIADLLGVPNPVSPQDVVLDDDCLGPGYGRLDDSTREAMRLAARCEGLVLDPVYSAKAMAALIAAARQHRLRAPLFIHTGGEPALFAYGDGVWEAGQPAGGQ